MTNLFKIKQLFTHVRDCIQAIGQSHCSGVSIADRRDVYHTPRLASDSQSCCMTPFYELSTHLYLRLSMGISVSPASWQQFIDKVFENISNRKRYKIIMDAAMIFSRQQHFEDTANLFKALTVFRLKISSYKSKFVKYQLNMHKSSIHAKRWKTIIHTNESKLRCK